MGKNEESYVLGVNAQADPPKKIKMDAIKEPLHGSDLLQESNNEYGQRCDNAQKLNNQAIRPIFE